MELERVGPTGEVLRWRLTLNAVDGGPVPFLISHYSEQPARWAPRGLTLDSFEIEDPDPASITAVLSALGADDVSVKPGSVTALVAHLGGPSGRHELR